MSGETDGGSNKHSHMYGFPGTAGQDRHIQSIIEHAANLFPQSDYHIPRFHPDHGFSRGGDQHEFLNPPRENHDDVRDLDSFDLNILGRLQRPSQHHYMLDSNPDVNRGPVDEAHDGPRVSLPLGNYQSRPSRILGDASHHFRPFIQQDVEHHAPFARNPIHVDRLKPSPASQPIFERDGSYRVKELQPGTQLVTPPFYQPPDPIPRQSSTVTHSSSSEPGNSSPSMRLSLRKQARVGAMPPPYPHKCSQSLHLDLDHAPGIPPIVNNTQLVDPRQALPDKFRAVFPYHLFNVVQSRCFPLVYGTTDNVVISAPTGSGKTAILELAICKLFGSQGGENFKVVYQAPTKSLCSERARDWERKFSHMNLRCVELTGDTSPAQASRVGSASLIVTTPEKWDSVTRKWSDHRRLLEMVRLVLIDEVHMLNDSRGATLEAVVSRMKTIKADVRFIALSATVPNIEDIAKWLGRRSTNQQESARYEAFSEELRPVRLRKYVYGYEGSPNEFIFDKSLDGKLNLLLGKHSEKKPIMVFCFTRKSCETTAKSLAEWWSTCKAGDKAWPAPSSRVPVVSKDLQEIVRYGVAFHHGGLALEDRAAVEQNYLNGQLHVICCTSTLAVGVNLPCHTVVLKGTMGYADGKLQEHSDLDIMQMLGRAGRPQFDKSAVAIIMTRRERVERYNTMIKGEEMLESTLHRNLTEHLNSEIGLGTIQDITTAKKWIGGTFLSVRMRRAPGIYGGEDVLNAAGADELMEQWCERDIKLLQQHGLVSRAPLMCTEYGNAMSRYMVQFETMKLLLEIPRGPKLEEMLETLSKAVEFKEFRFKPAERALFRKLNQSPFILHPIKEALTQTWHKVSLMVQVHLGGVELPNDKEFGHLKRQIACEKTAIFDRLNRLVRCVVDCKAFDGDGVGTRLGLELARAIVAGSWENKPCQLSQIPGFGPVMVRKWISHGVRTVLGVADRDYMEIERISSRNPPYGKNVLKTLETFPRLTLRAEVVDIPKQSGPQDSIPVTVKVNLGHCNTKRSPSWNGKSPNLTFMVEVSDGSLAYFWRANVKKLDQARGLDLKFPVVLSGPNQSISCYFSCEEIVGTQITKTLEPEIPASAFSNAGAQPKRPEPPKVDLLDSDLELDEVDDADMIDALDSANIGCSRALANEDHGTPDTSGNNDDFRSIDDILTQGSSPEAEPQKMDNGKWMCQHYCRNGGPTKSGKPCSHKCCHEGVDKPRPPPTRQKTKGSLNNDENEDGTRSQPSESFSKHTSRASSTKLAGNEGSSRPASKAKPTQPLYSPRVSKANQPQLGTKRPLENSTSSNSRRKQATYRRHSSVDILSDIDCIDLSTEPNEARSDELNGRSVTKSDNGKEVFKELIANGQVNPDDHSQPMQSCPDGVLASDRVPVRGLARASHRKPLSTSDESVNAIPDTDSFLDDDEFPDLDELLGGSKLCNEPSSPRLPEMPKSDETLYPGIVQALEESIDYDVEPNLSFTTVNELQKASQRLGIRNIRNEHRISKPLSKKSASQSQAAASIVPSGVRTEISMATNEHQDLCASDPSATGHDDEPLFFGLGSSEPTPSNGHIASIQGQQNRPSWLSEYDSEIVDLFRGNFNFVD